MNFYRNMSKEEKFLYATMSIEQQKEFRRQKERQEERKKESGRRVESDELDIPKAMLDKSGHTTEEDKGGNVGIKDMYKEENLGFGEANKGGNDSFTGAYREENDNLFPLKGFGEGIKEKEIHREEEHSYIYIQFVIDATYSFSKVFPAVYNTLQVCMGKISEKKKGFPNIKVKYGLVMFNEKIETAHFGGTCFTEEEEVFMGMLRKMCFCGGSPDGYEENINKAVETGIRVLENESEEHANRGILLFTDSLPRERKPNFYSLDDCKNRGLRFAVCYMNNDEYSPMFRITDRDGDITESGKNRCAEIKGLKSLFGLKGIETIEKQIDDIMYKSSVLGGM